MWQNMAPPSSHMPEGSPGREDKSGQEDMAWSDGY